MTHSSRITPSVTEMSATLNAGQNSTALMKSTTAPLRIRSITFPSAPPSSIPVGSQMSGLPALRAKYQSSATRAIATITPISAPAPCSELNATPVLRTLTSRIPSTRSSPSPRAMLPSTSALVTWSHAITMTATASMRAHARPIDGLSADEVHDDPADDLQHDDGDDRAEVERAELRDEPPEDPQVRLADVAEEGQHRVRPARVGDAAAEREQQVGQDVDEDQDRVDEDHRAHEVGDVSPRRRQDRHRPPSRTASSAFENAVRRFPRSRASRPRAVEPPGDVTSWRTVSVSRSSSSAAVPPIVPTTSRVATSAGIPRRTPASIWASA